MRSATFQQTVRCPNCGSKAQRRYFTSKEVAYSSCSRNEVIQTECHQCDYLMVMCSLNGNVIEAHSPGISTFNHLSQENHLPEIEQTDNWPLPLLN